MKEFIVPANEFEEEIARTAGYKELIRCKECKHGKPGACGYGVDCEGVWHDDDWFCADGTKDGEQE